MIDSFKGEYAFLSNFYQIEVDWDGVTYPSIEHAFQAAKTLDESERLTIQFASTSSYAKRLGRRVTLRPDWEEAKRGVMRALLNQKFAPGSRLLERLLDTGDEELIEGNHWGDIYWGVCDGVGENHLGKLLMTIRADLDESA